MFHFLIERESKNFVAILNLPQWLTLQKIRNLKSDQLAEKSVISMEWAISCLTFLPPSIYSNSSIKTHPIYNDRCKPSCNLTYKMIVLGTKIFIVPFIQEYPSPLQTISKPLHPSDASLSSL